MMRAAVFHHSSTNNPLGMNIWETYLIQSFLTNLEVIAADFGGVRTDRRCHLFDCWRNFPVAQHSGILWRSLNKVFNWVFFWQLFWQFFFQALEIHSSLYCNGFSIIQFKGWCTCAKSIKCEWCVNALVSH